MENSHLRVHLIVILRYAQWVATQMESTPVLNATLVGSALKVTLGRALCVHLAKLRRKIERFALNARLVDSRLVNPMCAQHAKKIRTHCQVRAPAWIFVKQGAIVVVDKDASTVRLEGTQRVETLKQTVLLARLDISLMRRDRSVARLAPQESTSKPQENRTAKHVRLALTLLLLAQALVHSVKQVNMLIR